MGTKRVCVYVYGAGGVTGTPKQQHLKVTFLRFRQDRNAQGKRDNRDVVFWYFDVYARTTYSSQTSATMPPAPPHLKKFGHDASKKALGYVFQAAPPIAVIYHENEIRKKNNSKASDLRQHERHTAML